MTKIEAFSVGSVVASKTVGIPSRTLTDMAKKGKIPAARRVGRRYVFIVEELKQWVNQQAVPGEGN